MRTRDTFEKRAQFGDHGGLDWAMLIDGFLRPRGLFTSFSTWPSPAIQPRIAASQAVISRPGPVSATADNSSLLRV